MKLCYRGTFYERAPCLEFADGAVCGKYRGVEWRSRHLQTPIVLYSVRALTYRGIPYLSGIYRYYFISSSVGTDEHLTSTSRNV